MDFFFESFLKILIMLNNWLQQHRLFKTRQSNNESRKVSSAEVILVIALCYYVVVGVATTSTFALYLKNYNVLENELQKFYSCEEEGHNTNDPCDESGYLGIIDRTLTPLGYILLRLYPLLHLVYVLNIKSLRKKCLSCCHSMKGSLRQSTPWAPEV